ncbi:MAG TPA: hypothetical protein PK141_01150 [Polyangiaceae bacterium]|nr:hypothetical protein [Polyangiaceae bacterium]
MRGRRAATVRPPGQPGQRAAASWWERLCDLLRPARLELRGDQSDALFEALRELGATVSEREWQMAGATERTVFHVDLHGRRGRVFCDSYEGPRLVGDAELVAAVEKRLTHGPRPVP